MKDGDWCCPQHIDEDWRLCLGASNAWMGTVEDSGGEEIMDLTEWAGNDFAAAHKFATDTAKRYNARRK